MNHQSISKIKLKYKMSDEKEVTLHQSGKGNENYELGHKIVKSTSNRVDELSVIHSTKI